MNGQPETEQLQNFDDRLSQWISNQGFWFQLRYSLAAGGGKGTFTFHALRLLARVGIFLVVVAAGVWIYLVTYTDSARYTASLSDSLQEKFAAEEMEMGGFSRRLGEFRIGKMAMIGGEDTFFTGLDIRNLRCEMDLLDSFRDEWDPGLIEISKADVSIRAGSDSKGSSEAIADVLFQDTGKVKIDAIQVADMSMRWGYSERTRGRISGSNMKARRVEDGWRLMFRGGTFSQNWLKRLEIVELDVVLTEEGIVFEKAEFKKAQGYVILKDVKVESGERPQVSGKMELIKMDLSFVVPVAVREFVEGRISGNFDIMGSTNSSEGVGFEGLVSLDGEDLLILRDRVHLLRALSVVDAASNYRRVDFTAGSLRVKSHANRLEISDADLSSEELMTLEGGMIVRAPTTQEMLEFNQRDDLSNAILTDDELEEKDNSISLEAAAKIVAKEKGMGLESVDDGSLFDKIGLSAENQRVEEKEAVRLTRTYRYEGNFTITLREDAFARAPKLAEIYPVSAATGRIPIEVPINGLLYDLTLEQSNEVYKNGSR